MRSKKRSSRKDRALVAAVKQQTTEIVADHVTFLGGK